MRDRMPWRHLDRKELVKAVKSLPRLRRRAGLDPSRCRDGACGWCGVAESCGWHTSKQRWPDGTPAPLCRSCHEVRRAARRGPTPSRAICLRRWAEAMTGRSAITSVG